MAETGLRQEDDDASRQKKGKKVRIEIREGLLATVEARIWTPWKVRWAGQAQTPDSR